MNWKETLRTVLAEGHLIGVGLVLTYVFIYAYRQPEIGISAASVEAFIGVSALGMFYLAAKDIREDDNRPTV